MKIKKILFVTQDSGRHYSDLGESYNRAFKQLNYNVIKYNLAGSNNRVLNFIANNITSKLVLKNTNNKLIQFVKQYKPDLIFVGKGSYLLPETILKIKGFFPDVLIICFNPDDPYNQEASNNLIRDSIKYFDAYFSYSKKLALTIKIRENKSNVFYLPCAADTDIIYPAIITDYDKKVFDCDVSFIGNGDSERHNFISILDTLYSNELNKLNYFKIYGSNWKKLKNIKLNKYMEGLSMLKVFSGSKININILRTQNKNSHNMRTFEIPAAKGFMLHERSEEALEFFEEGKEADYFSNQEELMEKIKFYLNHETLRIKIAEAAYSKIFKANYTYIERVRQLMNCIYKISN